MVARSSRKSKTDEQLALRLHHLELNGTSDHSSSMPVSPDQLAEDESITNDLISTFSSLETLDNSFLPETPTSTLSGPSFETLRTFYDRIRTRPAQMDLLRALINELLIRPGENLSDLKGNWIVAILESPVFSSSLNFDERREMFSKFIGLVSNVSSSQHRLLISYLSSPLYPSSLVLSHIQLLIPHLSSLILSCPPTSSPTDLWQLRSGAKLAGLYLAARNSKTDSRGSSIKLSEFYVTAIDALGEEEWIADFLSWEESAAEESTSVENLRKEFRFCQYPFLLSLGVKKRLLEFENQRQIMDEASAAMRSNWNNSYRSFDGNFFSAEDERQMPLLVLDIRRNRLVQDSLQQISMNRSNLRKSLRIRFADEEGIDAGGLRKEWFLLLCRSLFSPSYGMFLTPDDNDEDSGSNLSWFNPGSVGMVDEEDYWLLGSVVGMGCYHADTLDIPLPTVTYKKLLGEPCTSLSDLAQFRPSLARGLQHLLDYDQDDVEEVFCSSFVGTYEVFGELIEVELCEGGKDRPVTRENRREYVALLVDFLLNKSISTQFEAFSAGFNEVCSGNALSLLRGEELELIVRGSDEPLDIETLKSVTTLHGFYDDDPVITNFWNVFRGFNPKRQKQLLAFITSSDRIPSTGITALRLKITCMGRVDSDRLPTCHSCFNELCLWQYSGGEERLERLLIRAMDESEGFGLR
ncbi:putative E3 ubiquitin-protein ligase HUL4 [Sporobolomyces salmoneus]|uniref:putative E3 ubiquitin-protein ligase HUL4 n=1 Tax=Sporobolomyces salmoneus TaxID=183962 RepID=UPI0031745402